MSIIDITQASLQSQGPDYNKFDLSKENLKARALIPTGEIAETHIHSIYRSEAQMVANDKGRLRPEWPSDSYAGTYICLGEPTKVSKSPSFGDPTNCPACAAMSTGPKVVDRPKKQYALNVIQYQTSPNTFDVVSDNVEVKLWKHGADTKISPIITALNVTKKKINQIDFIIECPPAPDAIQFKKWQINFTEQVAYNENPERKANVVKAINDNLYSTEELENACGDRVTKDELEAIVREAQVSAGAVAQASSPDMFSQQLSNAGHADIGQTDLSAESAIGAVDDLLA